MENNTENAKEIDINLSDIATKATENFNKARKEMSNKLNVLIAGKTGVGKSTLINTVFGDKVVKTGSGEPITQEISKIDVSENFSIYDTKGLEMKDFDKTYESIEKFTEEDRGKEANEQIKVVWLCISEAGRRIEDGEKKLYKLFKDNGYVTFIVITKAMQDKD